MENVGKMMDIEHEWEVTGMNTYGVWNLYLNT